jgi:hypothetical protein
MLPRGADWPEQVAGRTAFAPTIAVCSPSSIWCRITLPFQPCGVIHVLTAQSAAPRSTKMTICTIDNENNITVFATAEAAAAASTTPFDLFTDQKELAELLASWPAERWVGTYNSLPGVKPVKALKDPKTAASKIWERVEKLGQMVAPEPVAAKPETARVKVKAAGKAKAGAQAAKGAPTKSKSGKKKAPAAKAAPKGRKAGKAQEAGAPRAGSKTAQVIELLQRKNGASISEIMQKMGWLRHTVRGFMAGAMKKAGFTVESFKPAGGERSYRLPK